MKTLLSLLLLLFVASLIVGDDIKEEKSSIGHQNFDKWREQNKKKYQNQDKINDAILKFAENNQKIDAHNKLYDEGKVTFKQNHWKHSDLSLEQKRKLFKITQKPARRGRISQSVPNFTKGPASVDWKAGGLVSPVQDQGK